MRLIPEGQRKRAQKPKTTTGCRTCKRRRVKCDEARPSCRRCVKFGVECEGYATKVARYEREPARALVPLAPRKTPDTPSGERFQNQADYAYFEHFRLRTANGIAGPFRGKLWTRTVLQACHDEPAIRALVTSIGALELAYDDTRTAAQGLDLQGETPKAHKLHALAQYGKGLGGVQNIARSGSPGALRKTLIASILIYCFENMYGGVNNASLHAINAIQCMKKELARYNRAYCHIRSESPTPDLEDDLVAEFVRLDRCLSGRPATWNTDQLYGFALDCDFSQADVPAVFSDVEEARNYFEHLSFMDMPSLIGIWAATLGNQREIVHIPASMVAGCKRMDLNYHRWLAAFKPILRRAKASQTKDRPPIFEYTLQLKTLAGIVTSQVITSTFQKPGDTPTPTRNLARDCKSAIDLARLISAQPDFSRGFVWDNSVVTSLTSIIMLAPKVALRREALELLRSMVPRRENLWDSVSLVKLGQEALQWCPTDEISYFRNLRVLDPDY